MSNKDKLCFLYRRVIMKIVNMIKMSISRIKARCPVCNYEYDDGYCAKCPVCGQNLD